MIFSWGSFKDTAFPFHLSCITLNDFINTWHLNFIWSLLIKTLFMFLSAGKVHGSCSSCDAPCSFTFQCTYIFNRSCCSLLFLVECFKPKLCFLPRMSRIERKYCLLITSYMAGLFDIFILLHMWQNCLCFSDFFTNEDTSWCLS